MSAPKKPRVLFVGAFPPEGRNIFGGNVTACRALMASSFASRLDVVPFDSTQISNPPPPFRTRLLLASRRVALFFRRFEQTRPDAVLLFVAVGASVVEKSLFAWYARLRGVPALIFPRGGALIDQCERSWWTRTWTRAALRGGRLLLCQEKTWQRFAVDVIGFPPERAPIVPNWTATTELLRIGEARQVLRNPAPRLLFLGWLDREKGVFELLEACRRARTREFCVHLVGEGNASHAAREFVATHGLEDRIVFRGWRRGSELESELRDADVLVLPSWAEGLPNAMVEAMAAKLAIIATRVGNIPEVMEDGQNALLVPARDADALERAIVRVLDDPACRDALAAAAHATARRRFAVEPAVDRLVEAVHAAVDARSRR